MKRSRKATGSAPVDQDARQAPPESAPPEPPPGEPGNEDVAARLTQEVKGLREAISRKTAELRALKGQSSGDSEVVRRVVDLLSRPEGATKAQVVEETGAKKGYVDALLSRILPEKGYVITASAVSGQRVKTYRIP